MATPTPTPTPSVTPSVSPGCFNYNFNLQSIYFLTNAGPFDLSGVTSNGTTILIQTGVTLNQLTTGFTTTICSPITGGTVQSTGVCNSSFNFSIDTISPSVTPTPTPSVTPSVSVSVTPTVTPTLTKTPTVTPSQGTSPTPQPSPSNTPQPSPSNAPIINEYYYQPNSWVPPSVNQGAGDNFLSTSSELSTEVATNILDYTTTNWSYSVWGLPQFEYTSLPTANDTYVSNLVSICVPSTSPPYPDTSLTNLTIAVEYTSGVTLTNDLVVWMLDDMGRTAKWTWSINSDTNATITGVNSSKMWDISNFGTTLNTDRFSNIVITHDNSLVVSSASGSTLAYWNGTQLQLKSYEQPDIYPHTGDFNSLNDSKFYIAQGSLMGNTTSLHPLSTNIDNPIYFPSTILSPSNAVTIYNNGVVQNTITTASGTAFMWNFDNISLSHLECINQTSTQVSSLSLTQNSGGGGTQTYVPI